MKRGVFLGLLSYTGTIWLPTHHDLLREVLGLIDDGWNVYSEPLIGCSYIHSARGQAVSLMLQTDATDIVFVDWDMCWQPGAMRRLLEHEVDVVAADYPKRKEPIKYNARFLERDGKWNDDIRADGLLEVKGMPTGFMRISRRAIERMIAGYPNLKFDDENEQIGHYYGFFGHLVNDKVLLSDDYSFCDNWRAIGGEVWCDTTITVSHIGFKMFTGKYLDWLKPTLKLPVDDL